MFLRHIAAALRTQNWTAITIELLIVILGVFIGNEVSNWYADRRERSGEREYLRRLDGDLEAENRTLANKVTYHRSVLAAALRTDDFIHAGRPCAPGRCWPVLADFFAASQWQDLQSSRGVMESLQRTPYPYDRRLKQELFDYYRSLAGLAGISGPSDYRRRLRMLIPARAQRGLWACNIGIGEHQQLNLACPPTLSDAEARAIVERLRADPDLALALNFQTSTLMVTVDALGAQVKGAEALRQRVRKRAGR
jgi:hypothetical protein